MSYYGYNILGMIEDYKGQHNGDTRYDYIGNFIEGRDYRYDYDCQQICNRYRARNPNANDPIENDLRDLVNWNYDFYSEL